METLGCFVEIEAKDPKSFDKLVDRVAKHLGLDPSKRVDKTYLELLLEKS